ncbi:MAG: hypothetical protein ACRC3B_15640, partial [Bacteroidia bacterium]
MIHSIKGNDSQLEKYVRSIYNAEKDIALISTSAFICPHILFRSIVDFFRSKSGNELTDRLLNEYKVPLSLIYDNWIAELTAEELKHLEFCAARTCSNYVHSPAAKSELIEACADVIIKFYKIIPFRIIIGKPESLDVNSVDLIKHLYHLFPEETPDLIIAYNNNWGDDERDIGRGISHYYGHDTVTFLQAFVYAFENVAAEIVDLTVEPVDSISESCAEPKNASDYYDKSEFEAFELLRTKQYFTRDEAQLIMNSIRRFFRMYDFYNALFMGLEAREKIFIRLTNAERADLLHIIGLSAHTRHFFTQGNQALADFLKVIFQEALQNEMRYK